MAWRPRQSGISRFGVILYLRINSGRPKRIAAGIPAFRGQQTLRGGPDAKTVIHDSLTLDVALNPDFSQVESDDPQVTVNQRFYGYRYAPHTGPESRMNYDVRYVDRSEGFHTDLGFIPRVNIRISS